MIRSLLAVLTGTTVWGLLWTTGNDVLVRIIPEAVRGDGRVEYVPALIILLVLSVVLSVLAGGLTAWIARKRETKHTLALGIVQFAIGMAVQIQYIDLMPLWYYAFFLLLLIPGNVAGGILRVWLREKNRYPAIRTT